MKQYGLAGFVVVVCLLAIVFVLKDLLKKSDKKDAQIVNIATRFATSLDANTKAIDSLQESQRELANSTNKFHEWLFGAKALNDKEHADILQFCRRQARS